MATLIGLVGKLPPAVVKSDPRLQLALAWANIVLHRIPAAEQALDLMESALATSGLSDDEVADLRAEGGVVRGVADLRSDRLAGIAEHIAPCLAGRDRLRPFAVGVAATVATFAAAYHYDLDEVNRIQAWAAPYNEHNKDTFNIVHGLCFSGLAHQLMLDIPTAETCFRKALKIAKRSGGTHSYLARLASSALGELLYERGDLDEAARLLEEGYKLGPEGGSVDFKIFRYVIAAQDQGAAGRPARCRPTTRRGGPGRAHVVTEAAPSDGRARARPPRASCASGFRFVAGDVVHGASHSGGRHR